MGRPPHLLALVAILLAIAFSGCVVDEGRTKKGYEAMDAVAAFHAEGLRAGSVEAMERSDYGDAPHEASSAVRFVIWDCADCWSYVFAFDDDADQAAMFEYYQEEVGSTYNVVFQEQNVVVPLRGPVDTAPYQAALDKHLK